MTENFASYGDPDKSAQARLARVQAALGCKTWTDLADLLELPVSLESAAEGEDAALDELAEVESRLNELEQIHRGHLTRIL